MKNSIGLFVTVDGPNGVGKSALVSGLVSQLSEFDIDAVETSEPTNSPLGDLVRELEADYSGKEYACLVAADRYFHITGEIDPALQKGQVIVSARYIESSLVLQRLDKVQIEFIWALNSQVLIPDISIILTAPAEVLDQRIAERSSFSRFEQSVTRKAELEYYLDAAKFLSNRGFNVIRLDNGHIPLQKNIDMVTEKILNRLRREQK